MIKDDEKMCIQDVHLVPTVGLYKEQKDNKLLHVAALFDNYKT